MERKHKIALVVFFFSASSMLALTVGVGSASLFQSATSENKSTMLVSNVKAEKSLFVESESFTPPSLKVEVVREGRSVCLSTETPTIQETRDFVEYTISRPIANCPDVKKGDSIKATWTFHSDMKLSSLNGDK